MSGYFPYTPDAATSRLLAAAVISCTVHAMLLSLWAAPVAPHGTVTWFSAQLAPQTAAAITPAADTRHRSKQPIALTARAGHARQPTARRTQATQPLPSLDLATLRASVVQHDRTTPPDNAPAALRKPQATQSKTPLQQAIEQAARPDCRSRYAGAGLLAVIPLAIDSVTGSGCKW
jgi:hypothetical protein